MAETPDVNENTTNPFVPLPEEIQALVDSAVVYAANNIEKKINNLMKPRFWRWLPLSVIIQWCGDMKMEIIYDSFRGITKDFCFLSDREIRKLKIFDLEDSSLKQKAWLAFYEGLRKYLVYKLGFANIPVEEYSGGYQKTLYPLQDFAEREAKRIVESAAKRLMSTAHKQYLDAIHSRHVPNTLVVSYIGGHTVTFTRPNQLAIKEISIGYGKWSHHPELMDCEFFDNLVEQELRSYLINKYGFVAVKGEQDTIQLILSPRKDVCLK